MPLPKKKLSKGAIAAIVAGATIVVLLLVFFLVLPRIVASKITAEADRRALTIDFSTPTLGFSQVTLRNVVIQPKANAALKIQAPTMTADLSGFSPTQIHLIDVTIDVTGAPSKVNDAVSAVREADAKIPAGEKLPLEIVSGKLVWKDPLGGGTSMKFDAMHVLYDPRADTADAQLQKGTLDLSSMKLSPLEAHVTTQKKKTHVTATLSKDAATLDVTRDADGDVLDITFSGLNPSDFDAGVPGLDLSRASIDGDAHYERDGEGAASAKADVKATKLKLPPIPIGPLSISLGTSLRLKMKASPEKGPKKGSAGTMKIDSGTLEIAILGTTRTVTFGGELKVGEDGTGPFKGNITWSTETIQCADISPIKGVTGTIGASGTLTFDLADLGNARLHPKIDMGCDLGADGLNNLLKQIP